MIGLFYCFGLLVIGGALTFVLCLSPPWMPGPDVKQELVKIAMQVLVFGVAGGAVKLLLDRQAELRKFRSDMLERLGGAHKDVYRVRRLLATVPEQEVPTLLGELMDARQDLGATSHTARVWGIGVPIKDIQRETEAMRRYLEDVIRSAFATQGTPERAVYDDFLNWRAAGSYESSFKDHYFKAKKMVDSSFQPPAK